MSAQLVAGADSLLASRLLASAATFRSRRFALRSSVSSFASRSPLDITPLTSRGVDKACLTPKGLWLRRRAPQIRGVPACCDTHEALMSGRPRSGSSATRKALSRRHRSGSRMRHS